MNKPSPVNVYLEAEPKSREIDAAIRDDGVFRILVLADMAGVSSSRAPLSNRRSIAVDRDDFDEVMRKVAPAVNVRRNTITFRELDDFHPDQLWRRLPLFDELRSLRDRLDQPSTFESAARELLGETQPKPQPRTSGGSLLEEMLEDVEGPAPAGTPPLQFAPARDELREHIRRIVMPHIVPNEDPRKMELSEKVEQAATELMREILHDPAFQAMEATWRALHFLVQRLETGSQLYVRVFDVTRAELAAELETENGALHRLLVEKPRDDGAPWSVLVGDYTFGPSADDVGLLNRMAALARRAGAPFVAAGDPQIAGAPGFDREPDPAEWTRADTPEWSRLRNSSDAQFIGLVAPRFLIRMPYGEDSDSTEVISFEEMTAPPRHADYLWANGAYAAALLLAESYASEDASGRVRLSQNVSGLPLYVYKEDGLSQAKPCAESVMTERAANRLAESGLMPLASLKDSGEVRLVRFQSIAQPSARLARF